jgi:hypothetical protein
MAIEELNKRVQQPRNTTQTNDQYIGPPGQLVVDTDRWEFRLHNGRRKGGFRFPNLDQLKRMFISASSELGGVTFPSESRGFMVRVADKVYRLRNIVGQDGGITVDNADGAAGNPTIKLPLRLVNQTAQLDLVTNLDAAVDSGRYITTKTANALPAGLAGIANAALDVYAGVDEGADLKILQVAISLSTGTNTIYRRRFAAGVWGAWA